MDGATRGLAQQRGRPAMMRPYGGGASNGGGSPPPPNGRYGGHGSKGRVTSPAVTCVDQHRMLPRGRIQAAASSGKRPGPNNTAQRIQRQFSPHPSPATPGDPMKVNVLGPQTCTWEHWVERSSRAAAALLFRVDSVLAKVDSTLLVAGADVPSPLKVRPGGSDSLSTEKMEALAERLAALEAVLDNASQRRSLGFNGNSQVVSTSPPMAKTPPMVLSAAQAQPVVDAWIPKNQSTIGTPRTPGSQQVTPRVSLRLQPNQRRPMRHLSEPRGLMGLLPRTPSGNSARSSSRSCSPHPPLPQVGLQHGHLTVSLSAPNSMILPLVAIGTPPVGGSMPMTPILPSPPPLAQLSLVNPPAYVANGQVTGQSANDPIVGKIRSWLGTIPIGNGAERGWDDRQVESIAVFAVEHKLGHLSAEDIYRRYVEHHLENADQ